MVLLCSNAEGIYLSMLALVKAGDSCIVSTPCYQSLHSVAEALGTKVIKWNVKKGTDRWFFDLEELERYFVSGRLLLFLKILDFIIYI